MRVSRVLTIHVGIILSKCLGVFIGDKRVPRRYFDELLVKVRSKLSIWKCEMLSLAARKVLLHSVLTTMPWFMFIIACLSPFWRH